MIALKILYYLILMAAGIFLYVRLYEAKAIFFPSKKIATTPRDLGLDFEDVFFPASDKVVLNGWLIKSLSPNAATVLFFHGNAGNISHRMDKIGLFHKIGLNVFIIDYRGYGKSQGHPSEAGLYLDAAAAYDYLGRRSDIQREKVVLYGESIGGVAAVDLASTHLVAAVILEAAFSSARDMAKVIVPFVPTFLLNVKMDSIAKIPLVQAPKLFIHSLYDEIVPYKIGRRLFAAATEPKEFLEIDGDHNEGYALSYAAYRDGMAAFLRKYQLLP